VQKMTCPPDCTCPTGATCEITCTGSKETCEPKCTRGSDCTIYCTNGGHLTCTGANRCRAKSCDEVTTADCLCVSL
jgi:hypothetical protein